MHQRALDRDLAHLFRAQRRRIAVSLAKPKETISTSRLKTFGSMVVLTTRTAQGTRRHIDVEMPTDLTRDQF